MTFEFNEGRVITEEDKKLAQTFVDFWIQRGGLGQPGNISYMDVHNYCERNGLHTPDSVQKVLREYPVDLLGDCDHTKGD